MRFILLSILFSNMMATAQTTVDYKITVQADYSTNLINVGSNNISCYSKYLPNLH